jgi:predicted nucleic acid-binding protein
MKVALDTNCLLDAADVDSHAHGEIKKLLAAAKKGKLELFISLHSLSDLKNDDPLTSRAREIGAAINRLPHYPIGAWKEQICTWDQITGTWLDAQRNQEIQEELFALAKAGNDIRDRGACIDSVLGGVDVFLTSDRHLQRAAPLRVSRRGLDYESKLLPHLPTNLGCALTRPVRVGQVGGSRH